MNHFEFSHTTQILGANKITLRVFCQPTAFVSFSRTMSYEYLHTNTHVLTVMVKPKLKINLKTKQFRRGTANPAPEPRCCLCGQNKNRSTKIHQNPAAANCAPHSTTGANQPSDLVSHPLLPMIDGAHKLTPELHYIHI